MQGVAISEGAHRDGHEWQIVAVFDRENINGGQSQFLPNGGGEPFFGYTLQPGEVVCNEDAQMWHNVTDFVPVKPEQRGHRDIFIVATNRWHQRRYGEDFDRASLKDGLSDWQTDRPDEFSEIAEAAAAVRSQLPNRIAGAPGLPQTPRGEQRPSELRRAVKYKGR